MTIKYLPAYQGFTYLNLGAHDNSLAIDCCVENTLGLLNCLELYAGHHVECLSNKQRVAHYYSAMLDYTNKHENHKLADSFRLDGLGTAKTCLFWRDLLVEAGWSGQASDSSGRMEVLCGIEEFFDCPGTGERINMLTKHIDDGCSLPPSLKIVLGCPEAFLAPSLQKLFLALRQRGVNIEEPSYIAGDDSNLSKVRELILGNNQSSITFNEKDESFRIYKFKQRQDALNWLVLQSPDSNDVWIDSKGKDFDNTLELSGQPVCGSVMKDVLPQISQLLVIGLNLIPQPLNIQFLLEWLHAPVSPLEMNLRDILADTIVSSGGYYNSECKVVIDSYLKGEYDIWKEDISEDDKQKIIQEKKRARNKAIRQFLPSMEQPADVLKLDDTVSKTTVADFVRNLSSWVKNRMFKPINDNEQQQLRTVMEQAEALTLMLEKETDEHIPVSKLQGWINSLYEKQDSPLYEAEQHCRSMIAAPELMAEQAERTIWCDFYGGTMPAASYSFLSQKEVEALVEAGVMIWKAGDERKYNAYLQKIPFLMTTKRLSLVVVERDGSTVLPKHPLMILLEQNTANLDAVTEEPQIADKYYQASLSVDNSLHDSKCMEISNADKLEWRDHESATSLDNMIQHPFDYAMQYLFGIRDNSISTMMQTDRIQGDVAHAVIANLFHKEGETNNPDAIRQRVESAYDTTFSSVLLEKGSILLLRENRVDVKILKDRLRNAIETLLCIMQSNQLHVVACEKEILRKLDFTYDPDIKGFVDMILGDDTGGLYVFDFKWTSSKNRYPDLLKKNGSLQLALYHQLVERELGQKVVATAYYLMPENCLYSIHPFIGENTTKLDEEENLGKDLFTQIQNAYEYRRQQIGEGKIELYEGQVADDLQYVIDTNDKNLMPLRTRNGMKDSNIFSNYTSFRN